MDQGWSPTRGSGADGARESAENKMPTCWRGMQLSCSPGQDWAHRARLNWSPWTTGRGTGRCPLCKAIRAYWYLHNPDRLSKKTFYLKLKSRYTLNFLQGLGCYCISHYHQNRDNLLCVLFPSHMENYQHWLSSLNRSLLLSSGCLSDCRISEDCSIGLPSNPAPHSPCLLWLKPLAELPYQKTYNDIHLLSLGVTNCFLGPLRVCFSFI